MTASARARRGPAKPERAQRSGGRHRMRPCQAPPAAAPRQAQHTFHRRPGLRVEPAMTRWETGLRVKAAMTKQGTWTAGRAPNDSRLGAVACRSPIPHLALLAPETPALRQPQVSLVERGLAPRTSALGVRQPVLAQHERHLPFEELEAV